MDNENLMISGGIALILFSWMQIALAYVSYKSENKRNAYKRPDPVVTPMGDVDLFNVRLNHLELVELRERLVKSKHDTNLLTDTPSHQRIKDKLYELLVIELKLDNHAKRYNSLPGNLDECITTINTVINAKSLKIKNGWTIFILGDLKTHPEEGSQVLCFVPNWGLYSVLHLIYEDNGRASWYCDTENIPEVDFPLVWQKIDKNHAKTQNNS